MNTENFNLKDLVYLVIKPDGTIFYVMKNNQYHNHYLYIDDFRRQDPYLMEKSFGLIFQRDDNIPKIMFFKELIMDSCIIFENQSIYTTDEKYAFDFCLPDKVTSIQKNVLDNCMFQIDAAEYIFLETYQEEIEDFQSLCSNLEEMKTSKVLKNYIDSHLVDEKKEGVSR